MLHYPKRLMQGFPAQRLGQSAGRINQSDAPAPIPGPGWQRTVRGLPEQDSIRNRAGQRKNPGAIAGG